MKRKLSLKKIKLSYSNPTRAYLLLFALILSSGMIYGQKTNQQLTRNIKRRLADYSDYFKESKAIGRVSLEKIMADDEKKVIQIYFSENLAYAPIRESRIDSLTSWIQKDLGKEYQAYRIRLFADKQPLETFVPNYYRERLDKDNQRTGKNKKSNTAPLITDLDAHAYTQGLQNKNIALWHSHGLYFDASTNVWRWQRPRLFGSVEDLGPMRYVLPFLAPMLENAGATTFIPRERDTNPHEIIVDNDGSSQGSEFRIISGNEKWRKIQSSGFAKKDTLFEKENPFTLGSHLAFQASPSDSSKILYLPEFPEDGDYAVYLSWVAGPQNSDQVYYTVHHAGGLSRFFINQKIGGKSWIYLGTFHFRKGKDPVMGSVELNTARSEHGTVTADAVRFGGGMGNVARQPAPNFFYKQDSVLFGESASQTVLKNHTNYPGSLSGKARFLEGARYYMQYSGIPAIVYSPNEEKNDYGDDYQSRGSWVNYLMGEFRESDKDTAKTGLNIPVDLSFAFHTDAGITKTDSIVGTLAIYSASYGDSRFPNGQIKMANRDLTDLIQTQITSDIQALFNPNWTRRGLWDKAYSEAWRPKVPSMLLELLSHQNLSDMRFNLDPRFRFAVSRSIYKGMLRFIAEQEKRDYTVQPLPPDHFAIQITGKKQIRLSWKAVSDPLEPTAQPTQFRVYKRPDNWGFDSGITVSDTSLLLDLQDENKIYSFKVTALNDGGESFPSEILSVCLTNNEKKPVLIVNAFDRICGPKIVQSDNFSGVAWWDDQGVPMYSEIGYVGNQFDYDRKTNTNGQDNPFWGASYADGEGKIIPGNTFDFTIVHGKSIAAADYPFVSVSKEYFEENPPKPEAYTALDLLFGEQRSTPSLSKKGGKEFPVYTPNLIKSLRSFSDAGIPILASGAYIGTDPTENQDTAAINFAKNYLHYKWQSNHADNTGDVRCAIPSVFPQEIQYNTGFASSVYPAEAANAIEPVGKTAIPLFYYQTNNACAAIINGGKNKTVIIGFPFETIPSESERNRLMSAILLFFKGL